MEKHKPGHKSGHHGKIKLVEPKVLSESVILPHDSVAAVPFDEMGQFPASRGEPATLDTLTVGGFTPHAPEADTESAKARTMDQEIIEPLPLSQPRPFASKPVMQSHFDQAALPDVPSFNDTAATEARADEEYPMPAGAVPAQPNEIRDDRVFDVSEIARDPRGDTSESKPEQKHEQKKTEPTPERKNSGEQGGKHGIKVSYDEDSDPEIVRMEAAKASPAVRSELNTRLDSVYDAHVRQLGDTSTERRYDVSIEPGMEKFLRENGDTIKIDTLPNGVAVAETFNGHGFTLGKDKQELMRDLEKHEIAGGYTVPEILEKRMDMAAWEKLQGYGFAEQRVYIDKVASKENIGPWMIASKARGTLIVFEEDNTIKAEIPFLFGATRGDGFNTYTSEQNLEGRTTPTGKYYLIKVDAQMRKSLKGQFGHDAEKDVWLMVMALPDGTLSNEGIALHGEISKDVEGQEKDVHSKDGRLHEETIGCERVDLAALGMLSEHARYVQFVLSEDPSLSYNVAANVFEKLTDEQIRQKIGERIIKFWNENLVLYNLETEEVKKGKNGVAEQVSSYYRDRNADRKIRDIDKKGDVKKVKAPRFIKR